MSTDPLSDARIVDAWRDVVVANFALIGKESVEGVIRRIPDLLTSGGCANQSIPEAANPLPSSSLQLG